MTLEITKVTSRLDSTSIENGSDTKFTEVTIRGTASKAGQAIYFYDNDVEFPGTTSDQDLRWVIYPSTLNVGEHKFKVKPQWSDEVSNEWVITVLPSETH